MQSLDKHSSKIPANKKKTHLATSLKIIHFWCRSCTFFFGQETGAKGWVRPKERVREQERNKKCNKETEIKKWHRQNKHST